MDGNRQWSHGKTWAQSEAYEETDPLLFPVRLLYNVYPIQFHSYFTRHRPLPVQSLWFPVLLKRKLSSSIRKRWKFSEEFFSKVASNLEETDRAIKKGRTAKEWIGYTVGRNGVKRIIEKAVARNAIQCDEVKRADVEREIIADTRMYLQKLVFLSGAKIESGHCGRFWSYY